MSYFITVSVSKVNEKMSEKDDRRYKQPHKNPIEHQRTQKAKNTGEHRAENHRPRHATEISSDNKQEQQETGELREAKQVNTSVKQASDVPLSRSSSSQQSSSR